MSKSTIPDVEIPDPNQHPAVVEARQRLAGLNADLAATRTERVKLERELGLGPKVTDVAAQAKLLAAGRPMEEIRRFREQQQFLTDLRQDEQLIAEAVRFAEADVNASLQVAVGECRKVAREHVIIPVGRAAAAEWLKLAGLIDRFRRLVDQLESSDIGPGGFVPLIRTNAPLACYDRYTLRPFAQELIDHGFTTRAEVNAVFPGLM